MLSNFAGNGNGANVSKVFLAFFWVGPINFPGAMVKRKSRQGLSLIELLIIFGMIMILGSICAINLGGGCSGKSHNVDAVEQATAYANFMYPGKNARVQCVRLDSDRDGYVSCTIAYDAENAVTGLTLIETVAVECAAGFTFNEGCRMPEMQAPYR